MVTHRRRLVDVRICFQVWVRQGPKQGPHPNEPSTWHFYNELYLLCMTALTHEIHAYNKEELNLPRLRLKDIKSMFKPAHDVSDPPQKLWNKSSTKQATN